MFDSFTQGLLSRVENVMVIYQQAHSLEDTGVWSCCFLESNITSSTEKKMKFIVICTANMMIGYLC